MVDPRNTKLAQVLVHYSCKIKRKQLVKIIGGIESLPLLKEVYREVLKAGAYPYVRLNSEEFEDIFFKNASADQIQYISPMDNMEVNKLDAFIVIRSPQNTKALSGVDPQRQAMLFRSRGKINQKFSKRSAEGELSWVLTQYPTNASAQDGSMSLADYEDFVFKACMVDKKDPVAEWKKMSKQNEKVIKYVRRKKVIRLEAPDTDITFNVAGRKWINCDGDNNFPDGEVFTAPVENSVNGHIRFSFPAVYRGREVTDVRLEFKNGKLVKANAATGEDYLHAMTNIDKGAKYLGEVAIGTNYGIQQFTKNILYDEKIGGTFHMALGNSYPESGGKNKSALHWDMICDLRKKGAMYADGEMFFKNGKFLK